LQDELIPRDDNDIILPTEQEIDSVINKLANKAAPGTDDITPTMWKLLWRHCKELVIMMIQEVWLHPESMPKEWSELKMTLLPKHIDAATDPTKVRTICMAQVILKVITSIIRERLHDQATTKDLLPDQQFGFRPKRSAGDAYFGLRSEIMNCWNNGRYPIAALVDIKKAFDSVNRRKLIRLLVERGFSNDLVRLIQCIDSKPKATIKQLEGVQINILLGVLQGDPLSPLLFALYIMDLPKRLRVWDTDVKLILYADDLVIICNTRFKLNTVMRGLKLYCDEMELSVNTEKTEIISFKYESDYLVENCPIRYDGVGKDGGSVLRLPCGQANHNAIAAASDRS
jgi:hypothetical protein